MEDLLLLQYPAMTNRIKKARDLGFSDDEIGRELGSRVERARAAGFSELEINRGLGVSEASRSLLQEARRNNALESISDAYEMTIPRARKAVEKRIPPALMADDELMRRIEAEDQQVNVGPMHDRPSVETLRTHSKFWREVNDPAVGAVNRSIGGMVTGFTAAAGGFARGMEWLTGWEAARKFADKMDWASMSLGSELLEGGEVNIWDAFWRGSGSLAFFMLPGMAVAKGVSSVAGTGYALGLSEKAAVSLAKYLGATTSGVMEGFAEAGPVYKAVLDATGDEGAANIAASKTFWLNLPLNILTDKLGFFGDNDIIRKAMGKVLPDRAVSLLANALSRGVSEGLQETGQGLISARYGEGKNWGDLDLFDTLANEGLPGFLVAAVTGTTFEAGAALHQPSAVESTRASLKASAAKVYEKVKTQLVNSGMDEVQAGANAALWWARSYTRGAQEGISPEAWYDRQNLSVQRSNVETTGNPVGLVLNQDGRLDQPTDPNVARPLWRMPTEKYKGLSVQERKVVDRLNRGRWVILSAVAPKLDPLRQKGRKGVEKLLSATDDDQARIAKVSEALTKLGAAVTPTLGEYDGPEVSMMAEGVTIEDALDLAREAGQESIMTNFGLVHSNGKIVPIKPGDSLKVDPNLKEYYTVINQDGKDVKFSFDLDWDNSYYILEHWSNAEGLQVLDPEYMGTGKPGEEDAYRQQYPEAFVPRTYHYGLNVNQRREMGLGHQRYVTVVPGDMIANLADQETYEEYFARAVDAYNSAFEEFDEGFDELKEKGLPRIFGDPSWGLVRESVQERRHRHDLGYTQIVLVDPKEVREAWEAQHGEKLVHAPERLERLRDAKSFDSYPKVSGTFGAPEGISISDGRHRIAAAEERGSLIPVAMDPDMPIPKRFIKSSAPSTTPVGAMLLNEIMYRIMRSEGKVGAATRNGHAAVTFEPMTTQPWAEGVPIPVHPDVMKYQTFNEKPLYELSEEELAEWGLQNDIPGFGPLTPMEDVGGVPIPGGLNGTFTYMDLMALKAAAIDPNTLPEDLRAALYMKLARSHGDRTGLTEEEFQIKTFNDIAFAILSGGNALFDNEFGAYLVRARTREDIEALAAGAKTKGQVVQDVQAKRLGLALKDAQYDSIAKAAALWLKDPSWFVMKPDESFVHYSTRLASTVPGLGTKTAMFASVFQNPAVADIMAVDRHMIHLLWDRVFTQKEQEEILEKISRAYAAEAKLKVTPQFTTIDEAIEMVGKEEVITGIMTDYFVADGVTYNSPKMTDYTRELRDEIVWMDVLPQKIYAPKESYLKALEIAHEELRKMGLDGVMGTFVWQWMQWDMKRGVVEPHEAVFPGMVRAPKMPSTQLAVAWLAQKELGWKPVGKTWNKPVPHEGRLGRIFYQDEVKAPRGRLEATEDGKRIISLFENADESTFMHETGHLFLLDLEEFATSEGAPGQVRKDWETLRSWLGLEPGQSLDVTHHEKFARGFEAWLREGEAPHPRLVGVFERFREWLTNVYQKLTDLDVELSDDVRGVFDRMFALEDEIETRVFYQGAKSVDELPPDPAEREETEAIMAMEGPANRAAEGDEEALFDPVWFKEGTEEGATEVDDLVEAMESIAMKMEAYKGWRQLVRGIRELGGISYDQIANLMGVDNAKALRETVGWLFRRSGMALDEMATRLAQNGFDVTDPQSLFNQLVNRPEHPSQLPAVLQVTGENLPWLLDRLGTAQTRSYLKRRIRALDALMAELDSERTKASDKGDEEMAALLKEEMWELHRERLLASETEVELGKAPREAPKGETPKWGDLARRARGDAFRWVQAKVLDTVLAVTGQTQVGELVSEHDALKNAMRLAQKYSRIAARVARSTGYRAGYITARQRVAEVKRRQEARAKERSRVREIVHDLDTATRGSISWRIKEEIATILEKFDTKRRGITQAVRNMAREDGVKPKDLQKDIDAAMRQYLAEDPTLAEEFSPDDLARLTRQSVYEMSMGDLEALHAEILDLREIGRQEQAEKNRVYTERVEKAVDELIRGVGGRKQKTGQKMVPGRRKPGKIEWLKSWTDTPSRILDWLDNYADFKGLWHNHIMRRADAAEDAFLRTKFSRHDGMMAKLKELGITESRLAEIRYRTVDPETGEEVGFTLDEVLEVYAGWMNAKKRDALRYGNGIDDAMKAEMDKLLKPEEIALVEAVLADYETRRKALKDALVETHNMGFLDEEFYSPMYRDSWEQTGELMDSGMEALKNEFLRINGLRRFYAKHGFSHTRKTISPEHQTPLQLGLFGNWLKTVDIQEHFIAYASLVKELQDTLKNKDLRETLEARYGNEVYKALEHVVNRLAVPDFYRGYASIDGMTRTLRSNAAVAYLSYNLGTILKQPTALAYYLRDAGPLNLLMSSFEFAFHPQRTLSKVWRLDPQVKDQAIERTFEELKRTRDPRYKRIKHAVGRVGFKPILWFDMVTRVIGWNAVYRSELAKGATPEDARYRAQRITLNTQQAAHPKELPRYMAHSEMLNLLTIFQNQANKVWNIASHDIWGDLKHGRIGGAMGHTLGLLTATFLLSMIAKGGPPDDEEELVAYLSEDIVGSIPVLGRGIVASWHGFGGGSTLDSAGQGLGRGLKGLAEFDFGGDEILALYEAYSLLLGGTPVTAVKRVLRALDEERPGALMGWRKKKQKGKDALAYF